MSSLLISNIREIPEYIMALRAALAVLISGLPIYLGLRYFLYRRNLAVHWRFHLAYLSVFILSAGLAFLLASPLANLLNPTIINAYLFVTCVATAYGVVLLTDLFVVQHYVGHVLKIYISPPLRTIFKISVFCFAILPILRYVLHFNPLTLVAIPTILTAGIALALQDTLKTFFAGIGLGKMIRLGEWIAILGKDGKVVDITWAHTILQTLEGDWIYVPNTQLLTQPFTNYGKYGHRRMTFLVPISRHAAPARVKEALLRSVKDIPGIAASPSPVAELLSHDEGSSKYGVHYWITDYSQRLELQDKVGTQIWDSLRQEQIEITFPFASAPIGQRERGKDSART